MLGLYIVVSLALFVLAQRDLFAEMNLRQSQMGELEATCTCAPRCRMSAGSPPPYGQLSVVVPRAGSGAAGAVRTGADGATLTGQLFDGLPRSTQLGCRRPGSAAGG